MSQADSLDTTTTSRRALLAGAPSIAAVALTAGAAVNCLAAARATSSAADAELLSVGAQFDAIYSSFTDLLAEMKPLREECDRRLEPFLGAMILGDRDVDIVAPSDEIEKELGLDECHLRLDAINEAMDAAVRRIIELPASTLPGLAVKARMAATKCRHFWRAPEEELDYDNRAARALIESVLATAGSILPLMPGRASEPDEAAEKDYRDVEFGPLKPYIDPEAKGRFEENLKDIQNCARVSFEIMRQSKAELVAKATIVRGLNDGDGDAMNKYFLHGLGLAGSMRQLIETAQRRSISASASIRAEGST
jgi:hypothetical protein